MSDLNIPDYMTNTPASMPDLVGQMQRAKEFNQNQQLNQIKIDSMPKQIEQQQQTAGLDIASKKMEALKNFATDIKLKMQETGIPETDPRFQPELQSIYNQYGPIISQVTGKPFDPNEPVHWEALKHVAGDVKTEYHPPVPTSQGYLEHKNGNFTPMLNAEGKPYMPAGVDVGNKFDVSMASALGALVQQGHIPLETAQSILKNNILKQPPAPPAPQAQAQPQAQPQVSYDFANTPQGQADKSLAEYYQNNVETQKNQMENGGQPPAPTTAGMIPSLADTETLKADIAQKKDIAVANAKSDIELAQKKKEGQQEAQQALPVVLDNSNYLMSLIDSLKTHKGLEGVVGMPNLSGAVGGIRGTAEKDFNIRLDQIKGKTFQEAFASLKGAGAITDVEGKKASEALARLDTAQTEKEFIAALDEFQSIIKLGQTRAKQKAGIKIESNAPRENRFNQTSQDPFAGFTDVEKAQFLKEHPDWENQ